MPRRVDGVDVDRGLFGVAAAAAGSHRYREELGDRPRCADADAIGVGDGRRLGARRERAKGGDAGIVRRGDDLADTCGADLGRRPRGRRRVARRPASTVVVRGRPAQSSSSSTTLAMAVGVLGQPEQAVGIRSPRRRDTDALPDDHAQVDRHVASRRRSGGSGCWRTASATASSAMTSASASVAPSRIAASRARSRKPERVVRAIVVQIGDRLTTCRPRPGHPGSARPGRHARHVRSGSARPCRSSACPASRSCARRRRRHTIARTRR